MPKERRSHNKVIAKNKSTGLFERIILTPETKQKFAKVGAPRKTIKPKWFHPYSHPLSLQEQMELLAEREEQATNQTLLAQLVFEKQHLKDRISSPPPPLIERLSSPSPPKIHIPPPIPADMHFKQTKILK